MAPTVGRWGGVCSAVRASARRAGVVSLEPGPQLASAGLSPDPASGQAWGPGDLSEGKGSEGTGRYSDHPSSLPLPPGGGPEAPVTSDHSLGALRQQKFILVRFWGQKSEIEVWAGRVARGSGGPALPRLTPGAGVLGLRPRRSCPRPVVTGPPPRASVVGTPDAGSRAPSAA